MSTPSIATPEPVAAQASTASPKILKWLKVPVAALLGTGIPFIGLPSDTKGNQWRRTSAQTNRAGALTLAFRPGMRLIGALSVEGAPELGR